MGEVDDSVSQNEAHRYLAAEEAAIREHYDRFAPDYARFRERHRYYYEEKRRFLCSLLPNPGRVLEVGCGLGDDLAALIPTRGLGIDCSLAMVQAARARYPESSHPHLEFRQASVADLASIEESFDLILIVNTLTQMPDLTAFLDALRPLCTPSTRIVQLSYNYLLAPVIRVANWLKLAPPHPVPNWLTRYDLDNLLHLKGYQVVRDGYAVSCPVYLPLVSGFLNRFLPMLPGVRLVALQYFSVFRMLPQGPSDTQYGVSVCVPCKDEREHIAALVQRIPEMGSGTEIIFVDDCSRDGTAEAVRAQQRAFPEKQIKLTEGPGEGKGAACRAGFALAEHEILMILDADMTVMPEELPAFYKALVEHRGEFINGSRLVYPLEEDAMRFANILGNKLFAMLFSVILSQPIKDTLCGTKVIWRRDYEKLMRARAQFGNVDKWGDYDWIFGAARNNLKIIELPVHYRKRFAGQSKMTRRLRNALIMLRMCWIGFWKVKVL